MTVVWISDTNYHKILRTLSLNFSKNYCSFEKLYPKLHSVFHPISRHLEVGFKNFFNPLLSVWISDETLRVVLDILLSQCNDLCTFLAWPSRKSVSKLWMLLPHRYLDEMGHASHSSSKGIISAMLQEAESPPTFSKKSETMFTPLCTLKITL